MEQQPEPRLSGAFVALQPRCHAQQDSQGGWSWCGFNGAPLSGEPQTLVPPGSFWPATQFHVAKADEEQFKGDVSAPWLVFVLFACLLFVAIIRLPLYLPNRRALRTCDLLAQQHYVNSSSQNQQIRVERH